ncbi:MAG: cadherin-like domain-containing protein, partial [Chlorobiaceae bacterium]|nr:cadherin-like domain-containing protein [Chlorobiaceae bacterium]
DASSYDSLGEGQTQVLTIPFRASDASSSSEAKDLVITITGTNDVPVASAAVAIVIEDMSIAGNVTATDADAGETATLTYSLDVPAPTGLTFNSNGSYTFDASSYDSLANGQTLELHVPFHASDASSNSALKDLVIIITGTNDVPVASAAVASVTEDSTISGNVTATDADAGETATLTYSLDVPAPTGLTFNSNGSYTFDASSYDSLADGQTLELHVPFHASDAFSSSAPKDLVITITGTNDAPVTSVVTLASIGEDSGGRWITQAELLANATDVDNNASLTASGLVIANGHGTLTDNHNGTWSYTPALNDDTSVSFSYTISDGDLTAEGSAQLDITPVNDAPVTTEVTLASIAEDSGARVITETELLANATDVDNVLLSVSNLVTSTGTLAYNGDHTWNYTPAHNDDTSVSFSYTISDGDLTAAGSAKLDITPVNDPPVTSEVVLAAIAEDSGVRVITETELLAHASDTESSLLSVSNLVIASGNGSLTDNHNGTWSYTPALNDDTSVNFSYTISDGDLTAAGSAKLDITPVNDAPVTTEVTLAAIAEDSGLRVITETELLAHASDTESSLLSVSNLVASSGTLAYNGDHTWNYTPVHNDDTSVSFNYTISDGDLTAAGSAQLDITPVNDAPIFAPGTPVSVNVNENQTAVMTLHASDVDNDTLSYSLLHTANTDFNSFAIDSSGVLTFNSAPDFENPLDVGGTLHDNAYVVDVRVDDGHGGTAVQTLTVQVQNVIEVSADPNDFDNFIPALAGNYIGTSGNDNSIWDYNSGNIMAGREGDDYLGDYYGSAVYGQSGNDTLYTVFAQNSQAFGGSGNDYIYSYYNTGDTLYGGSGNDVIESYWSEYQWGSNTTHTLYGGYGADSLAGGYGYDWYTNTYTLDARDTFGFLDILDTGDLIYRFESGRDNLDFSAIDANPSTSGDQAFTLTSSSNVVAHGINYFNDGFGNTIVRVDTDGNVATAEMEITLSGIAASTLNGTNFIL